MATGEPFSTEQSPGSRSLPCSHRKPLSTILPSGSRSLRFDQRGATLGGMATGKPFSTVLPSGSRALRRGHQQPLSMVCLQGNSSVLYGHRGAALYGMATFYREHRNSSSSTNLTKALVYASSKRPYHWPRSIGPSTPASVDRP